MHARHILIISLLLLVTGCGAFSFPPPEPEAVEFSDTALSPRLKTLVRTDHQGFHELTEARAFINMDGSTSIVFQPALPAYWLGMDLRVMNGTFRARPYGTPFTPETKEQIAFEVTKQELILQDVEIAPGRIISGCASVNFTQHTKDGPSTPHFFTGCFSAPVFPEGGYTPLSPQSLSFLSGQEYALARHELGEPMRETRFRRSKADAFQSETIGTGLSRDTEILEATWNTSLESQFGDGGRQRLSVWYTRQGDQWFPVTHKFWTKGFDQVPEYLDSAS